MKRVNKRILALFSVLLLAYAASPSHAAKQTSMALFLPAVGFPNLQGTISLEQLRAVRTGRLDPNLILDDTTASNLLALGVPISPQTRRVTDAELDHVLWLNRATYTLRPFDRLTVRERLLHVDEHFPLDIDLTAYPFAFADVQPSYQPDKLTRILMTGTTAIVRLTADAVDQRGIQWAGDGIRDYTRRADFVHLSNEVSFDPTCIRPADRIDIPYPLFCTKESALPLLPYLGVNIVELTGNHNLDYGPAPYLRTLDLYRATHIQTLGGGRTLEQARQPLRLVHNGNRVTLLACNWAGPAFALAKDGSPGAAFCDRDWLRTTLPSLARDSDLLIVSVQYTEFTSFTPLGQQRLDFRELADLGASVVIGTQAHTPQTFEFHPVARGGQAFIAYGLGNLYFDEKNFRQRFFMNQVLIYEGRLLTIDLFTGFIDDYAHPRPMTEDERRYFLRVMFEQSGF